MPPDPRRRQQDGFAAVSDWLAETPVDQWPMVERALFAIHDGSWMSTTAWVEDATDPLAVIMLLDGGVVLRWRQLTEYPDYFRVTYVGPLDDF